MDSATQVSKDRRPRWLIAAALVVCAVTPWLEPLLLKTRISALFTALIVGGTITAALVYLLVWMTLGAERFWRRTTTAWGLLTLGAGLLGGDILVVNGESFNLINFWRDWGRTVVLFLLVVQLPLWIPRYFGVHLSRAVADPHKPEPWRLRDLAVGAVICGAGLSLLRDWIQTQTAQVAVLVGCLLIGSVLIILPAVWYTLSPAPRFRSHFWFSAHLALLLTPAFYQLSRSRVGFAFDINLIICLVEFGILIGGYCGLLLLRDGGYRLTSRRTPTPTTAAAPTSPLPAPK